MKTLYFEGAGCVSRGEVENCRIRTAFHNDKGQAIFLEITGHGDKKPIAFVLACDDITHEKTTPRFRSKHEGKTFEYSKAEILKFVNATCECSFDKIVALPHLAGYDVFGGKGYNFGDQFHYDETLTKRREAVEKYYYDLEKSEGRKYPNFSVWVGDETTPLLHILRHFNGPNKHWTIDASVDDWQSTLKETPLSAS